jgi:hypothetical protein
MAGELAQIGRIPKRPLLPSSTTLHCNIRAARIRKESHALSNGFLLPILLNSLLLLQRCSAFVSPQQQQLHTRIAEVSSETMPFTLRMVVSSPPSSSVMTSSEEEGESDGEDGSSSSRKCKFMYMTEEEDRLLKEQGDLEASLMQTPMALTAMKLTGLSKSRPSSAGKGMGGAGAGGFGGVTKKGGAKKKKNQKQQLAPPKEVIGATYEPSPEVQALTQVIREDGLVRIDNVLSGEKADELRDYLIDLRKRAKEDIETGKIEDSQQRFADVLLNQNRCDLKIPLGPKPVHEALLDVLNDDEKSDKTKEDNDDGNAASISLVRSVIEGAFDHYTPSNPMGSRASLWELNCFMSNSGARRQLVHADCVCLDAIPGLDQFDTNSASDPAGEPILLTCFIALQDIDPSMGPTVFMPKTHNIRSHNVFFETGRDADSIPDDANHYSPKNEILRSRKSVIGAPLPKGSCIIFDPRVLHCAGANDCSDPDKTRALFYMTFKNPKVDSPGCPSTSGYGIANAELTMNELVSDLLWMERGKGEGTVARRVPLLAASP